MFLYKILCLISDSAKTIRLLALDFYPVYTQTVDILHCLHILHFIIMSVFVTCNHNLYSVSNHVNGWQVLHVCVGRIIHTRRDSKQYV